MLCARTSLEQLQLQLPGSGRNRFARTQFRLAHTMLTRIDLVTITDIVHPAFVRHQQKNVTRFLAVFRQIRPPFLHRSVRGRQIGKRCLEAAASASIQARSQPLFALDH
jgi:hypothetical protein